LGGKEGRRCEALGIEKETFTGAAAGVVASPCAMVPERRHKQGEAETKGKEANDEQHK